MSDPSWREAMAGAGAIAPVAVAAVPISLLWGALAAGHGLSPLEAALMSALVFAGSAQFVVIELWREPAPWLLATLTAAVVNLRHVLMGASIAPKLGGWRPRTRYAAMALLADEIWAMAERRSTRAALTPAYFCGLALLLYAAWVAGTGIGTVIGGAFGDPAAIGFDFAFTAVFIGLLAGFWSGRSTGLVLAASAAAAIAAHLVAPGPVSIVAGSLAGAAVGAVLPPRRQPFQGSAEVPS